MTPMLSHRRRALLLTCALSITGAFAQFRPPPATEAERLTFAGDDLRAEAAKQLGRGEKETAQETFKKAIAAYEKALETAPTSSAAAAGLGAAANALGDY